MKKVLILFGCFLIAVGTCAAQTAGSEDTFKIGVKSIVIPAPAGFVNGYPGIPQIKAHVSAFEDPEGRTLAMYVVRPVAQKLLRGERVETLDFYAKIAVRKEMDNIEVTPEMFADLITRTERDFEQLIDADLPKAIASGRKSLEKFQGKPVDASLSRPINLGSIDKRPNVYSILTMSTIEQPEKHTAIFGVIAYITVKGRMLYLSIFKESTDDKDAEMLRDFSRRWADEILAANR